MCCIQVTSFWQVPKQASSVITALLGCLALSRFICSINNLMCPLIIFPLYSQMLALSQLLSLLPDRIGLYELIPLADPIFYSRAIPFFRQAMKARTSFPLIVIAFHSLCSTICIRSRPQPFPSDSQLSSLSNNQDSPAIGIQRLHQA
jgi:hypothetical protein